MDEQPAALPRRDEKLVSETFETHTWEQCQGVLNGFREKVGQKFMSPVLFRGHGDSGWFLESTLDRNVNGKMSVLEYSNEIRKVLPTVETFAGKTWDLEDIFDEMAVCKNYDSFNRHKFPSPTAYSYMVHLRHHGFPSPLLDWSRSGFVAAFFAFREALPGVQTRSIYAFCEAPRGAKAWNSFEP